MWKNLSQSTHPNLFCAGVGAREAHLACQPKCCLSARYLCKSIASVCRLPACVPGSQVQLLLLAEASPISHSIPAASQSGHQSSCSICAADYTSADAHLSHAAADSPFTMSSRAQLNVSPVCGIKLAPWRTQPCSKQPKVGTHQPTSGGRSARLKSSEQLLGLAGLSSWRPILRIAHGLRKANSRKWPHAVSHPPGSINNMSGCYASRRSASDSAQSLWPLYVELLRFAACNEGGCIVS